MLRKRTGAPISPFGDVPMMQEISSRALSFLSRVGWNEFRIVDTRAYEKANEKAGFYANKQAVRFLSSFGGLRLDFPHAQAPDLSDSFHFDAETAASEIDPLALSEYEERLGKRLTVIGQAHSAHMTLCMDNEGGVYGGYEDYLARLGDTGVEAINNLCDGRVVGVIPADTLQIPNSTAGVPLTPAAARELARVGWFEGRCVSDPTPADQAPSSHLPPLPPSAADFIREFGGLAFCYKNEGDDAEWLDISHRFSHSIPYQTVGEFERTVGQRLAVVGRSTPSETLLLMSEDGRCFACMAESPDILWFMGTSGVDAINRMFAGARAQRVI